jgi:hypothetical protein
MFLLVVAAAGLVVEHRIGFGFGFDRLWSTFSAESDNSWERENRSLLMRGCFRVSSLGTDVPGVYGAQDGPVARCVSVADTSLSLSLSLFPL